MSGTEIAEGFKFYEFYFMFNLYGWVVFWGMNNFIKSMGDQFNHLNLFTSMCDEFIEDSTKNVYQNDLLKVPQEMFFPNFAIILGTGMSSLHKCSF